MYPTPVCTCIPSFLLYQVYAEGANLKAPLFEDERTCLHLAIEQEDLTSLHIIDFILANSRGENCVDCMGNTPLHIAALTDNPQCIKLLLNHNANLTTSEFVIHVHVRVIVYVYVHVHVHTVGQL